MKGGIESEVSEGREDELEEGEVGYGDIIFGDEEVGGSDGRE